MQVKTILNRSQKFKSFVYEKVHFVVENGETLIEIMVRPPDLENAWYFCENPITIEQSSRYKSNRN